MQSRFVRREVLHQLEFDEVAPDTFNATQPDFPAVAEFVELPGLRAEDATEMVGSFPFHDRTMVLNFSTKKRRRMLDSFSHDRS